MRRFTRKQVPYGPLWYLSGLDLVEAAPGTATFRLPVTSWLRSGAGVVTGGAVVFAADAALGGALHPTFPPNVFLATAELAMDFLEPPAADAQAIVARGSLLRAGSAQGLTEASIEDGAGRLLARATSRCIVRRLPDPPPIRSRRRRSTGRSTRDRIPSGAPRMGRTCPRRSGTG